MLYCKNEQRRCPHREEKAVRKTEAEVVLREMNDVVSTMAQ